MSKKKPENTDKTADKAPHEITPTELSRMTGWSRDKAKALCGTLRPVRHRGRTVFYDLGECIRAALDTRETQDERRARLQGDIAEERLKRLRGEVVDKKAALDLLTDVLVTFRSTVCHMTELPDAVQRRLLDHCQLEITKVPGLINESVFSGDYLFEHGTGGQPFPPEKHERVLKKVKQITNTQK
ncbi:hypothetical protein QEH59_03045 [Coraliomargarita sp. SDUM461004]|uniref:Uncharacterized protein n=1 Tax=Thalassobacterium sedimentorum TaxID=3041258 RepID=A0ABU1AF18_9BACT|nr:hypothetical protein [Coraliomargarita sp. SDUM461004]MDQ8193385.1 hypothetical protein [Coraliomargarita sp. SDUM461004]